jgi:hypothetical protein
MKASSVAIEGAMGHLHHPNLDFYVLDRIEGTTSIIITKIIRQSKIRHVNCPTPGDDTLRRQLSENTFSSQKRQLSDTHLIQHTVKLGWL